MKQKNKRVVIWDTGEIDLIEGRQIGGIAVQMYFWAHAFVEHGWEVYSFAENAKKREVKEGIIFLPLRNIHRINMLLEWSNALKTIATIHPDLIIYRGANRALYPLAIVAKIFGRKLVMFGASDVNFEPGKEMVGTEVNRKLYQKAIRHIPFFVTQNQHQHDTLLKNYGKESLIRFNIWGKVKMKTEEIVPSSDAVWVANFRRLKRAEWVLEAARKEPELQFIMAGGKGNDMPYYEAIRIELENAPNVAFLGPRSFFYTCELVAKSKILLCTSTFEGFPNTFLQAWSQDIPVISTVDPSGIIGKYKLGEVVQTEEELTISLRRILNDEVYYHQLQKNVNVYFRKNHSSEAGYNNIINYIS